MKRSAPLKIQNGMVTHTQTANGQREAPSRWPSRYGQGDEVAAPNESSPGKVLEEIAREGSHQFMLVISHAKPSGIAGAWAGRLVIVRAG